MNVDETAVVPDVVVPDAAATRFRERFTGWLAETVRLEGSDLHIKVGAPPAIRVTGELERLDEERLGAEETKQLAKEIIPPERFDRFQEFGEVDFAHSEPGVGRFRANVFRQRGSVSMVFRLLRIGAPTIEEMGLPPVVRQLADGHRGLVLVTGPTGSGKTTTLAAMVGYINSTRKAHIVTIEDPIEVLHTDNISTINQREVGEDTQSFLLGLRASLRQDPDVILIGEMRDAETVQAALQAAETGHLVFSTLHTVDATETINRLVDFFPPFQQQQIRLTIAGSLRGILCQRLVPTLTGGRVACLEALVNTGRVEERIADGSKTSEIHEVIKEGGYYGMQTFDQALVELIRAGWISVDSAMEASTAPHDLKLMLEQAQLMPSASPYLAAEGEELEGAEPVAEPVAEVAGEPAY